MPDTRQGEVSDGYHTFNELYEHRHSLFAVVLADWKKYSFKTRKTQDGREYVGWFIAGINSPIGQVTYHMPDIWWDQLHWVPEMESNELYDGHTSQDVLFRLAYMAHFAAYGEVKSP